MRKIVLGIALGLVGVVAYAAPIKSMLGADGTEINAAETEYTASDYIQDGLIAIWDAKENSGFGLFDSTTRVWKNLVGDADLSIPTSATWDGDALVIDRQSTSGARTYIDGTEFYSQFCESVDNRSLTVENYWTLTDYGESAGSTLAYTVRRVIGPYESSVYGWICTSAQNSIYFNANLRGFGYYWIGKSHLDVEGTHGMSGSYMPISTSLVRLQGALYYDGSLMSTSILPTSSVLEDDVSFSYLKSTSWFIGQRSYKNSVDRIHCVRIYNRTLLPEEVAYNNFIDRMRYGE